MVSVKARLNTGVLAAYGAEFLPRSTQAAYRVTAPSRREHRQSSVIEAYAALDLIADIALQFNERGVGRMSLRHHGVGAVNIGRQRARRECVVEEHDAKNEITYPSLLFVNAKCLGQTSTNQNAD